MAEKLKKAAAQVAKRRGNFTTEEVEILLNEVDRRKSVLFAKFSNNITNQLKIKHWTQIAAKVNACSEMITPVHKHAISA